MWELSEDKDSPSTVMAKLENIDRELLELRLLREKPAECSQAKPQAKESEDAI